MKDYIIAGTELITDDFLENTTVKLIARMGSGVDNINLDICKQRGIAVTSTPDIPVNAVAEFTVGQIISSLRLLPKIEEFQKPLIGREIRDCNIGIVGFGRIGQKVSELLSVFHPKEILMNDIKETYYNLETVLKNSDVISFHIPLKDLHVNNKNFITTKELKLLKDNAIIINTSRGAIINEDDLYNWLFDHPKAYALLDVFVDEPYIGKLLDLRNVRATPHIASYTINTQEQMILAVDQEITRFINNQPLKNPVI